MGQPHRLSNVNELQRTGTCSVCGPVAVYPQGGGHYRCGKRTNEKRLARLRERVYGVSADLFEALKAEQGGLCAICRREPDRWAVDHDHRSGRPRGLLCLSCNFALGHFDDDPDRLLAAIAYLKQHATS